MRIPVSLIVGCIANGMGAGDIVRDYPDLEPEDIQQALQYAANLTQEEVHPLPAPRPSGNGLDPAPA